MFSGLYLDFSTWWKEMAVLINSFDRQKQRCSHERGFRVLLEDDPIK